MNVVNPIPAVGVLLLGLLILGGLATVVILAAVALGRKKPGVAVAVVLVPLGLLLGLAVLGALFAIIVPHMHADFQGIPSLEHLGSGNPGDMPDASELSHVSYYRLTGISVVLFVALVVGVLFVVSRLFGTRDPDKHRGSWGKAFLLLLVVLIGARLWSANVADQQQRAQQEMERAKSQLEDARQQAEQAATTGKQSMQELWDKLNKPRIQLDADGQVADGPTATIEASDDGRTVAIVADARSGAVIAAAEKKPADRPEEGTTADAAEEVTTDEQATGEGAAEKEAVAAEEPDRVAAATGSQSVEHEEQPGSPDTTASATGESVDNGASMPRPAWVDQPPKRVGTVWREVVESGDYATREECYREADLHLMVATYNHLAQLTGMNPGYHSDVVPLYQEPMLRATETGLGGREIIYPEDPRVQMLKQLGINIDYIRRQIVPEDGEYFEAVERSVGPMWKLHTLVEFTPSVDRELRERWEGHEREERLAVVGIFGSLALCAVGLVYGLLKIDTWTKGYYTKRLFLGVPAAIIGLVALVALMNGL